jgi:hypothetical protein
MKLEWEAEENAKAAGMAMNHVMKYQNASQFRALPPPNHHQSFQPSAPAHAFHPPQSYTPSACRSCRHPLPCTRSNRRYLCLRGRTQPPTIKRITPSHPHHLHQSKRPLTLAAWE